MRSRRRCKSICVSGQAVPVRESLQISRMRWSDKAQICRAEVCCTVEKSKPESCSAAFHWGMLALMIPLHLALICTSTVLSLLVRPCEPIQSLRTKPNSVPALSNNNSTHGGSATPFSLCPHVKCSTEGTTSPC